MLARNAPSLPRLASIYARDRAQIDDLAQEMALALWRAIPGFRGECSERTFVFRVAHNVAVSHLVRRARPGGAPLDEDIVDPAPPADEALARADRRARLLGAIRSLPLPQREVVTLALEELSHEEIALVLDLTTTNVAVRLHRAKARLKEILEGSDG